MINRKQLKYFEVLNRIEKPRYPTDHVGIGICRTQLESYRLAQEHYSLAVQKFLQARRMWLMPGCPHWLAETHVLAGSSQPFKQVYAEVSSYKLDRRRNALIALYAYALLELAIGNDGAALEYAPGLIAYAKYKKMVAIGHVITAVVHQAQGEFDTALTELLEEHRRQAQHGELRGTPEAFLSLPGMCLARMALARGLVLHANSEYLSLGYLQYLASAA